MRDSLHGNPDQFIFVVTLWRDLNNDSTLFLTDFLCRRGTFVENVELQDDLVLHINTIILTEISAFWLEMVIFLMTDDHFDDRSFWRFDMLRARVYFIEQKMSFGILMSFL